MTTTPVQSVCCEYHYDPLNRSIIWTRDRQAGLQRFFCKERLATEIQNAAQRSIFQHDDQVLAQQNHWGARVDTTLLATDQQRSVLNAVDSTQAHRIAYTPYGHRPLGNGLLSLLGFNGERPDPVTGHYHLGNGYRQYNPGLLRFNSADKLSPFGRGGVNAYAYCGNDPLNWTDPNGSLRVFGIGKKSISTQKAEKLAHKITTHAQPPKHLLDTNIQLDDVINSNKYSKKSLEKINNKIDENIKNMNHHLKTINNFLTETSTNIANKQTLTTTNNELTKTANTLLTDSSFFRRNPPVEMKKKFEFIKEANSYYSHVKQSIPNIENILKENANNVRLAN